MNLHSEVRTTLKIREKIKVSKGKMFLKEVVSYFYCQPRHHSKMAESEQHGRQLPSVSSAAYIPDTHTIGNCHDALPLPDVSGG